MERKTKQLKTIGRVEAVDFPELNLFGIEAKVDTGAYTSSIHCENIRLEDRNGKKVLCFNAFTHGNDEDSLQEVYYKDYKQKTIRNSFGQNEKRFIVYTQIVMFGKPISLDLSLADRQKMRYPVLLGRKLLYKKFIVDVSKKNLNIQGR